MKFVFEDDERDPIPQLFMKAYDKGTASEFIYTRGNGNMINTLSTLVNNTNEIIIAYLDTIPGNDSTRRIYNKLMKLSRDNNNQIIVLPIIGSEYYFIKSIQNECVVTNIDDVITCVNRKAYFNSRLLAGQEERTYCKYYERYCKLILEKAVLDCVRNSEDFGKNIYFRWYYTKNCKCENPLGICKNKVLNQKSCDFLASYPCVPQGSIANNLKSLSVGDIWDIHRKLVDEHNDLCAELMLNEPDVTRKKIYKRIGYFVK